MRKLRFERKRENGRKKREEVIKRVSNSILQTLWLIKNRKRKKERKIKKER